MAFVPAGVSVVGRGRPAVCVRRTTTQLSRDELIGGVNSSSNSTVAWDRIVADLCRAFPQYDKKFVDNVLLMYDGHEQKAFEKLAYLCEVNRRRESVIQNSAERNLLAVKVYRLHRELGVPPPEPSVLCKGTYVDAGYVDENADTMKEWTNIAMAMWEDYTDWTVGNQKKYANLIAKGKKVPLTFDEYVRQRNTGMYGPMPQAG